MASSVPPAFALVAGVGVVVTALVAWFVARRQTSGTVATSTPGELWAASLDLRHDLRDELVASRVEVRDLRAELIGLRAELSALRAELASDRRARNGG
jgi:hypothetical protein